MRDYFCGWYFRCQSDSQTLAVIPAIHRTSGGNACSIQLITDKASWNIPFPYSDFRKSKGAMIRTIHEHAACRVLYRFQKNGHTLFEMEAPNAAFEYEYPH